MSKPLRTARGAQILAAAKIAGEAGISTDSIVGMSAADANNALPRLVRSGQIFKGKIGHRTVRYFARPEWAQAYGDKYKSASAPTPSKKRAQRAPWTVDTPAHYPVDADGKPLYKVTICPSGQLGPDAPIRTSSWTPC